MEQYISKDAVVAEIVKEGEKAIKEMPDSAILVFNQAYRNVLSSLDSIKVKEIDLEDSIKESLAQKYIDYTFKRYNIDPESREGQLIYYAYMHGMNQCLNQLNK